MSIDRITIICSATLVLAINGNMRAFGQDALGSGTALDSNLDASSGGINQARPAPNFRDRNLLITGDVIGGRGFRGSVGYTASQDFRGRLGSNDLFDFRAGSAISSPQLFGLGTTYQQVRFGQDIGMLEYRRANSGDPISIDAQDPISAGMFSGEMNTARMRLDRMALASSIQQALETTAEPRLVGIMYTDQNQPLLFQSSNLRGLTVEAVNQSVGTIGLMSLDAARIRQDVDAGGPMPRLGAAFETIFPMHLPGQPTGQLEGEQTETTEDGKPAAPGDKRVNTAIHADYDRILQRIADRYAGRGNEKENLQVAPELLSQLGEDYKALREQLAGKTRRPGDGTSRETASGERQVEARDASSGAGQPPRMPGTENRIPTTAKVNTEVLREVGRPQSNQAGTEYERMSKSRDEAGANRIEPGDADGDDEADGQQRRQRTPEEFGVILRHGERIERLSAQQQDRFNELMASAEQRLRDGDYFWAERRFERALRFSPGHPLASVGAAHSQIGAGLYLSASLALRNLLANQPEMIDVKYAPDVLPKRERLDAAVEALKGRLEGPTDRAAYAFLLAYIGHQLDDRELVEQGLSAVVKAEPDNALAPLLKSIWLAEPEKAEQAEQ